MIHRKLSQKNELLNQFEINRLLGQKEKKISYLLSNFIKVTLFSRFIRWKYWRGEIIPVEIHKINRDDVEHNRETVTSRIPSKLYRLHS